VRKLCLAAASLQDCNAARRQAGKGASSRAPSTHQPGRANPRMSCVPSSQQQASIKLILSCFMFLRIVSCNQQLPCYTNVNRQAADPTQITHYLPVNPGCRVLSNIRPLTSGQDVWGR